MPIKVVTSKQPQWQGIQNFVPFEAVRLLLTTGRWLVLGRVNFINVDGDYQPMRTSLVADFGGTIDFNDIYQPGDRNTVCYSLQGTLDIKNEIESVKLVCATYRGQVYDGVLHALSIDEVEFQESS